MIGFLLAQVSDGDRNRQLRTSQIPRISAVMPKPTCVRMIADISVDRLEKRRFSFTRENSDGPMASRNEIAWIMTAANMTLPCRKSLPRNFAVIPRARTSRVTI